MVDRELIQKEIEKAIRAYEEFHWGKSPKEILYLKHKKIPKVVYSLGHLITVVYLTEKGDQGKVFYIHTFDKPYPILASDTEGRQLYILGGRYHIEERGIVH